MTHNFHRGESFDSQFSPALPIITIPLVSSLPTALQMVSQSKNCELKQEPAHLQPSYSIPSNSTVTEKNIYSAAPEMWGRNCSEFVTSGNTFVLTLNRASALKVEGNEQNFLLPQNIVANTKGSV